MKNDPSLEQGYVQVYQNELSLALQSQSLSFQDQVMLRIFKNSQGYKLQMTSQMNISFFYVLTLSQKALYQLVDQELKDDIKWFKDIFSGEHRYQFYVKSVETGQLVVSQEQKFKDYELATFQFEMGDQTLIKESLMYRYQRMKMRQKLLDNYWQNMCNVIRTKNPSLLIQMEHKYKRNAFK